MSETTDVDERGCSKPPETKQPAKEWTFGSEPEAPESPQAPKKIIQAEYVGSLKKLIGSGEFKIGDVYNPYERHLGSWVPQPMMYCPKLNRAFAFKVAARIMQFMGENGRAFPKISTLSIECGVDDRTVSRAIVLLQEMGILSAEEQGQRSPHRYKLLWSNLMHQSFLQEIGDGWEPCCADPEKCYMQIRYAQTHATSPTISPTGTGPESDYQSDSKDDQTQDENASPAIGQVSPTIGPTESDSQSHSVRLIVGTKENQLRESVEGESEKRIRKEILLAEPPAPGEMDVDGSGSSGQDQTEGQNAPADRIGSWLPESRSKSFLAVNEDPTPNLRSMSRAAAETLVKSETTRIYKSYKKACLAAFRSIPTFDKREYSQLGHLISTILHGGETTERLEQMIVDGVDQGAALRDIAIIARYNEFKREVAANIPYAAIINYLNDVTSADWDHHEPTIRECIRARWMEKPGRSLGDFKRVIDTMFAKWGHDVQQREYLRPTVIFGRKFGEYLDMKVTLVDRGLLSRSGANAWEALEEWGREMKKEEKEKQSREVK